MGHDLTFNPAKALHPVTHARVRNQGPPFVHGSLGMRLAYIGISHLSLVSKG